jgi:hypothetical protein
MATQEEYPIKDEDEQKIIDRFNSITFCCIRCGLNDLIKSDVNPYADGLNFRNASPSDIETTFYESVYFLV